LFDMIGFGVFGWIAGALQLVVPSYALRLVRRFGTSRVGWFVVTAFASLALLHLVVPFKASGAGHASSLTLQLLYVSGSVLLLIGMGHVEMLISERENAHSKEQSLSRKWAEQLQNRTSELVSARDALLQELAGRDETIKALEESEARYRFLFLANPQPMWVMDLRSCRFLSVNQAALRLYGFSHEEFMALTGRDLLLPSDFARFLRDATQPCNGVETRGVWQHRGKDGALIEIEITANDLVYAGRAARLIVATDLGPRRRHELKLREAHRMEAISQVAGGVAHHFNNIFTSIEGYVAAMLDEPAPAPSLEQLEFVSAAVTRGASLTRQLLTAGGRQLIRTDSVDLNGLIRNLTPTLRRLVGEPIQLEHIPGPHLPPAQADRHLIEHVIVNLALNAREAMPDGGTLTLGSDKMRIEAGRNDLEPQAKAGDYVRLTVRDTGCGMTSEVQARLFEPFFTTREPGRGIGLGLASVQGILYQHAGWIEFSSQPGAGSEFRVYLPCAEGAFSVPESATETAASLVKGTILLVEPDDRRRALARFVLDRSGYRVIEADSGPTALVLWAGQSHNVDLLLIDMSLPGGESGRALAGELCRSRPGLKVIFSAEGEASSDEPKAEPDGVKILAKPYNPDKLLEAVRSSLEG
jgi:PAS domain S-box-containing protein